MSQSKMFFMKSDKEGYRNAQKALFTDATYAVPILQKPNTVPSKSAGIGTSTWVTLNCWGAIDAQRGGILITIMTIMIGTTTHRPIHLMCHASLMILMFLVRLMFLMLLTLIMCLFCFLHCLSFLGRRARSHA